MRRVAFLAVALLALATAPAATAAPPPAPATPDLDTASDTGLFSTDGVTADSTPTFTVNAGVAQVGMTVQLYVTTSVGVTSATGSTAVVPASGNVSLTAGAQSDGTYTFTAKTTSGIETSDASAALTVAIDTAAPVLAAAPQLVDFVGTTGTMTFTSTPRFDVIATTDVTVTLYEATTAIGSGVSVLGTARVAVSSARTDGTHTVYAKGVDLAGNASGSTPTTTYRVDTLAPVTTSVTLYAADDDGDSTTDRTTSNPRPRLTVRTEADALVTLYENGLALGSSTADSTGLATVQPTDAQWLDVGVHCLTTIAMDAVGNSADETAEYCITVSSGDEPFTTNLGVSLASAAVTLTLRSTLDARAVVRIERRGRVVAQTTRSVAAGTATRVVVRLPRAARGAARLTVVATLTSANGRTTTIRRLVRR